MDKVIVMGNKIYAHPDTIQELAKALAGKVSRKLEVMAMRELDRQSPFSAIQPCYGPSPMQSVPGVFSDRKALDAYLHSVSIVTFFARYI